MKLRLMICAAVASTALFAGEKDPTSATYAVMNVTNAYTDTVIAVPWVGFNGSDITISNLVNTTTLLEGDKLYMYDQAHDNWYAYTMNAAGNLVGDTTVSSESITKPDAAEQTVARGTGLILQRASAGGNVLLCGRVGTGGITTTIASNGMTLFANPTVAPVSLNDKFTSTAGAVEGDTITMPLNNGGSVQYTFNGTAWGKDTWETKEKELPNGQKISVQEKTWTSGGSIPPGTGAWYERKGASYSVNW